MTNEFYLTGFLCFNFPISYSSTVIMSKTFLLLKKNAMLIALDMFVGPCIPEADIHNHACLGKSLH